MIIGQSELDWHSNEYSCSHILVKYTSLRNGFKITQILYIYSQGTIILILVTIIYGTSIINKIF